MKKTNAIIYFFCCLFLLLLLFSTNAKSSERYARSYVGAYLSGTYSYVTQQTSELLEGMTLFTLDVVDDYPNHSIGTGLDAQISFAFAKRWSFRAAGGYVYRAYRSNPNNHDATHRFNVNLLFDIYLNPHNKFQPYINFGLGASSLDGGIVIGGGTHYDLSKNLSLMFEGRVTVFPPFVYSIKPIFGFAYRF